MSKDRVMGIMGLIAVNEYIWLAVGTMKSTPPQQNVLSCEGANHVTFATDFKGGLLKCNIRVSATILNMETKQETRLADA